MSRFSLQVDKWATKVKMDVKTFTRLVAFRVHDRIVTRTPVDSGRARASWTIIAGEVADVSVAPEDYSNSPIGAKQDALAKQSSVGISHSYVIANNLPYIEALENGHSRQAPAGMVSLAIADIKTELEVELG